MKNIGKLILATAILMIFAVHANAQSNTAANQTDQKQSVANSTGKNYVDKDNNGVCDNIGTRSGNGRGTNFVDKNNDGICDNRATAGNNTGNNCRNGNGNQHRHGQGRGNCCKR